MVKSLKLTKLRKSKTLFNVFLCLIPITIALIVVIVGMINGIHVNI